MTDQLPPFSGDSPICPKCGHEGASTRYRAASPRMIWADWNGTSVLRGPLPERLQRECERCDWSWDEALAHKPANDGPSIAEATADDRRYWADKYAGDGDR